MALTAAVLVIHLLPGCVGDGVGIQLPSVTDIAKLEAVLGNALYDRALADPRSYPIMDPAHDSASHIMTAYIDSIGRTLVAAQKDRPESADWHYTFHVLHNDTLIDAFGLPNGYIFITSGAVRLARNEAELAAILAHQLGHLTHIHGVKATLRNFPATRDSTFSAEATVLDTIYSTRGFLNYLDINEFTADSCALFYTLDGGWNPTGVQSFLQLLQREVIDDFETTHSPAPLSARLEKISYMLGYVNELKINMNAIPPNRAAFYGTNLALNAKATASSFEVSSYGSFSAQQAVDGDYKTRWSSLWSDNQWITLDLGAVHTIDTMVLRWEHASASHYKILCATAPTNWQVAATIDDGTEEQRVIGFPPIAARFVKILGLQRNTQYGYSLWEIEVYGAD
jgi:hypothetical protein